MPRAILLGALAVGVLDIAHARVYYGAYYGASLLACFQGVAGGLLGRAAQRGGLPTALLGAFLHFLIAFVVVYTFYRAARKMPALRRRALVWGPLYGVAVFVVMNYFVVPLSAAGSFDRLNFSMPFLLNGVLGHALLVGLPSALSARAAIDGRPADRR